VSGTVTGTGTSSGSIGGVVPSAEDIIVDLIGDVYEPIDVSGVNPGNQYTIQPLIQSSPTVVNNELDIVEPGVYLYNVYDINGALVFKLRVSVTSSLVATGVFEPGTPFNLEALSSGIAIQLRSGATSKNVTIGIGNSSLYPASAVSYNAGKGLEFDLLPYGLVLDEPADISVEFDKKNPKVQWYDTDAGIWKDISGVTVNNDLVSFSTQVLGKFRVYSEETTSTDTASSGGGGGGGGGCFIATAGL
jgi:hypothetical protein